MCCGTSENNDLNFFIKIYQRIEVTYCGPGTNTAIQNIP